MPPRRKLHRLWLSLRVSATGTGLSHLALSLFYVVYDSMTGPSAHCTLNSCMTLFNESVIGDPFRVDHEVISRMSIDLMVLGFIYLLGALVFAPRCRGGVIRWVSSIGKYASPYQEAAAVAALLNSRTSVVEAITIAKRVFRVLPLDRLTPADFATSTTLSDIGRSVESLFSRTRRADLGDCDAFVSHSWHDDATCKYARLKEHGWGTAEPTIWLDKVRAEPPLAITWLRAAATTPA